MVARFQAGDIRHTRSWEERGSGQKRFKTVVRAKDVMYPDTRQEAHDEPAAIEDCRSNPIGVC